MPGLTLMHVEDMGGDSAVDQPDGETRTAVTDLDLAMVVTSEWADLPGYHAPVLDLDLPAKLIPSSTPGNSHLLINRAIPWEGYVRLLDVLAEVGLLEPGYVKAAKRRGHTAVRVPWLRKGDPAPALPATAPAA